MDSKNVSDVKKCVEKAAVGVQSGRPVLSTKDEHTGGQNSDSEINAFDKRVRSLGGERTGIFVPTNTTQITGFHT